MIINKTTLNKMDEDNNIVNDDESKLIEIKNNIIYKIAEFENIIRNYDFEEIDSKLHQLELKLLNEIKAEINKLKPELQADIKNQIKKIEDELELKFKNSKRSIESDIDSKVDKVFKDIIFPQLDSEINEKIKTLVLPKIDEKVNTLFKTENQKVEEYELIIPENFKKEISGKVIIKHKFLDDYCIKGKIEINSAKKINPAFIFPENYKTEFTSIHDIVLYEKKESKTIIFCKGIVNNNELIVYPGKNFKHNMKYIMEFNLTISILPIIIKNNNL